ncbi:MAG: hypothetical protein O9256_01745 [Rhizobiaceae bacterium]|nr:hypothetical protein [Rhizobiaceae bacterium]MCZ8353060.1 hypothetical protein [Rhizobium sp.]
MNKVPADKTGKTKTKTKKIKIKTTTGVEIPSEHRELVDSVEGVIAEFARKDAEATFIRGHELLRVKAVLPEKMLGKWVSTKCGFTPRLARMMMSTAQNLASYRERLVALRAAPTLLYLLSSAANDLVEEVVADLEAGNRVTTAEVKKKMNPEGAGRKVKTTAGGLEGLRRAAEEKMLAELDLFNKLVKRTLTAAEAAASKIAAGGHVAKTTFAVAVENDCMVASDLFKSALMPARNAVTSPAEWERARRIIGRLGDSPRYPARNEFHGWIVNEVVPTLRFVVHGTPITKVADERDDETGETSDQTGASEPEADETLLITAADEPVQVPPASNVLAADLPAGAEAEDANTYANAQVTVENGLMN